MPISSSSAEPPALRASPGSNSCRRGTSKSSFSGPLLQALQAFARHWSTRQRHRQRCGDLGTDMGCPLPPQRWVSTVSSRLRERRPGVVARLGRQCVELRRSGRVDPRPGVAAPGIEEGRLPGQIERTRQRVGGVGRGPRHYLGKIVEVAVAERSLRDVGVSRIGTQTNPIPTSKCREYPHWYCKANRSCVAGVPKTLPSQDIQ